MMLRLHLLANALEWIVAGLVLATILGVVAGTGDEYSCAPVESDDDGEDVPPDPDLQRDYDIAADEGVL